MKNKLKLLLVIDQDQFNQLKYLIDLQLDKDNEDEQLIESLKNIRKQLSYPILQDHPNIQE